MFRTFSGLCLAGLICPALALAQPAPSSSPTTEAEDAQLEETMIVYGLRLEQSPTEVGSSVSVLTAADLEALGTPFVLDALAALPGVTINQNGSFGGFASVRIRGASSEQTLVIIDGIASNDPTSPGGGFDFARLDSANIERIEVLKGPQSTLWGTDAIGGVVNIVTKRPAEGLHGTAYAQTGSFDTHRGGAEISGTQGRVDFRLAGTRTITDGISAADEDNGNTEDDEYEATTLNARVGVELGGDARVDITALWTGADTEFDSFVFGEEGNVGDGDEVSETEELVTNISLTVPLFDGRLNNQLLVGYSEIERDNFTDGIAGFSAEGDRLTYRYQGKFQVNDKNRLVAGAEREETTVPGDDTFINGYYALYEYQPIESLTLTAGVRHDDPDRFDAETTPRVALAYNPHELVTLRASWGEGFKAPTLFQTTFFCCGATQANADLQPETSDAYDVGFTLRSPNGRGEIDVTYFDQDTTNLITFSFAVGGFENISSTTSSGFELDASYQFNDWLGVGVSYAYIDAEDATGAQLIRVPEHTANVLVSLNPTDRLSGTIRAQYNDTEQDANGVVDDWIRVDLAARYDVTDLIEVFGRVENLFDEDYQQVLGFGTSDLSGHVGVRLNF